MEAATPAYQISPLGDSALLIDFGNLIDEDINKIVLQRKEQLQRELPGVMEVVAAYSSISIYFDLAKWRKKTPRDILVFENIKETTDQLLSKQLQPDQAATRTIRIPVCYAPEFATDIQAVAEKNKLPVDEVASRHLSKMYRVYMLGFLPGYCYLGETDAQIAMPRKTQPVTVAAGSVGIAGKQTGIYPLTSPGGWQIIGRTPVKLFESSADEPTLFRAGDQVQLFSITTKDFFEIQNSNGPFKMTE